MPILADAVVKPKAFKRSKPSNLLLTGWKDFSFSFGFSGKRARLRPCTDFISHTNPRVFKELSKDLVLNLKSGSKGSCGSQIASDFGNV